jgi:hypothetical protein
MDQLRDRKLVLETYRTTLLETVDAILATPLSILGITRE